MMKFFLVGLFIIFSAKDNFCQTSIDTIKNESKTKLEQSTNPNQNNLPLQILNSTQKKVFGKTELPLNLQIYSRVFANDYKVPPTYTFDELSSGLSDEELNAFNNNKMRLQKVLSDFYGEDLINMEKLLESLGLKKEQIIALAALLKFIFVQGTMAAPK